MSKWYGKIGYAITEETEPGIWEESLIERDHYGDVISFRHNSQNPNEVNEDVVLQNSISIVSDPFANEHLGNMIYLDFMGAKWKIKNAEVKYPRIILSLGGVYVG